MALAERAELLIRVNDEFIQNNTFVQTGHSNAVLHIVDESFNDRETDPRVRYWNGRCSSAASHRITGGRFQDQAIWGFDPTIPPCLPCFQSHLREPVARFDLT